jgi:hypothetical protein
MCMCGNRDFGWIRAGAFGSRDCNWSAVPVRMRPRVGEKLRVEASREKGGSSSQRRSRSPR